MPLDQHVRRFLGENGARLGFPAGARDDPHRAAQYLARVRPTLNTPPAAEPEPVTDVHDETVHGGTAVRAYRGSPEPGRPILVYLHGGGWVSGGLEMNDALCRRLAALIDCVIVSVDYRLAPECPYPAALGDTVAAIAWSREHGERLGGDPSNVSVAGTSAGGNLAAAASLLSRDLGLAPLRLQLLLYPVLDVPTDNSSYVANAGGYLLEREQMEWYWDKYLPQRGANVPVYAAPGRSDDLAGLPPAIVVAAEFDPLRDEAESYAGRLQDSGVPTELILCEGMIHGFLSFLGAIPAADRAVELIADAVRTLAVTH
ncbi:MAG: acetyl esterase [Pseudonocardiales bacterium]|nr:acetyl esterase [Pseudonocardiales bacterium]